eukprot:Gb_10688 [translate_table: standard]
MASWQLFAIVTFGVFELCFCYIFSLDQVFILVGGIISVGSRELFCRAIEPDKTIGVLCDIPTLLLGTCISTSSLAQKNASMPFLFHPHNSAEISRMVEYEVKALFMFISRNGQVESCPYYAFGLFKQRMRFNESEILKAGQELLGTAIRLSSIYCRSINSEASQIQPYQRNENSVNDDRKKSMPHIVNIASCTIENLYELGIIAATGGGNLVTILNVSWKGVASLLQLEDGKEVMASRVNISNIILTLISLATDSLKLSSELWLLQSPDSKTNLYSVTEADARRACIPIKFYLINAVRISSSYPCQAFSICGDITLCVLRISALRFVLSSRDHLRAASEVLADILEPTSFLFLFSLLSSGGAGLDSKLHVLDNLFPNDGKVNSASGEVNLDEIQGEKAIIGKIFSSKSEDTLCKGILTFGQVAVFLNLLQNPLDLGGEVMLAIAKKLDWLLDVIAQEDIYVSTLQGQVPIMSHSDSSSKFTWQLMFPSMLHALQTFSIAVASSTSWVEVESFLFRNIIHPHALCCELVLELWCFVVRHAQVDLIEENINVLCSLLKMVALSSSTFSHRSLRKLARVLCTILKYAPQSMVEHVYCCLLSEVDFQSNSSSIITAALFQEAFPLHLLSDKSRRGAVLRITSAFSEFATKLGEKLGGVNSIYSPWLPSSLKKEPIICFLSLILSQCQIEDNEIEDECILRLPKLIVDVMDAFRFAKESSQRQYCSNLLSHALEIMSFVKHRLGYSDIQDVLTTLLSLCATDTPASNGAQEEFKPALALFLASLSAVEIPEDEGNGMCKAIWQLYHLILRERHWAIVHIGLASFGYFAARTNCNQLWRFVPPDAALSFDVESGQKSDGERFMSELKFFLEKEGALISLTATKEEKNLLRREGLLQKRIFMNHLQTFKVSRTNQEPNGQCFGSQDMEIDAKDWGEQKTQFSKGIQEGMSLLRKGLALLNENFAKWQDEQTLNSEQHDQFAAHLSSLAHVINQVASFEHS